jgi:hypothetical protein
MLFGPEHSQQVRDPDVDGGEAVEAGVAARADRDQEIRVAVTGIPVVNVEAIPCPAAGASESVPDKDRFPVPAEIIFRMPARPVTARAQTGDGRDPFAAGAEQRFLPESPLRPGPQEAFPAVGEG